MAPYDLRNDATAGAAVVSAIMQLISAHKAVTQDGAPLEILTSAQQQASWAVNGYLVEPTKRG